MIKMAKKSFINEKYFFTPMLFQYVIHLTCLLAFDLNFPLSLI